MDTTGLHKHPKKMKSRKDKHEVFVLPPDLLKKLGISIGNINVGQVLAAEANAAPSTGIITNECAENILTSDCSPKKSDTSILETANLMKKSVFLSPTFIPTTANVIPGEIELLSKQNSVDFVAETELEEQQSSSALGPVNSLETIDLLSADTGNLSTNIVQNGQHIMTMSKPDQSYLLLSPDANEFQAGHFDMIYDNKLGNVGLDGVSTSESAVNSDNNNTARKSSKINIISEETIPLSKLKELKRSQCLNISNLNPIPMNYLIDKKNNNENTSPEQQTTSKQNLPVPLKNTNILHSNIEQIKSGVKTDDLKLLHDNKYPQGTIKETTNMSLKSVETTHKRSDIPSDVSDNMNLLDNIDNSEDISRPVAVDHSITACEKSLENEPSNIDNEHSDLSSVDNIIENIATVNGFHRNENAVGVHVDKCINIHEYHNGEIDDKPQLYSIENCNEVEHEIECKDNREQKHICDITKNNLNRRSHLKSNNKVSSGNDNISSKNIEEKELQHEDLASILTVTKELSSSNTNIKADKVKELAAHLKKYSHIYTDKKKSKTGLSTQKKKKETINSNTNTIESKLCIQGVEKPGGNEEVREHADRVWVSKTYTRRNHPKKSKLSTNIPYENKTLDTVDVSIDHNLCSVNISPSSDIQEFCLCHDFGRLAYYDHDNVYEHIHFWKHNSVNCELNLIFSIYSDETTVDNTETELEQEQKTEEKNKTCDICWNILRNEIPENEDSSDLEKKCNELPDGCVNENAQPDLDNLAKDGNVGILSKSQDQAHIIHNSKPDFTEDAMHNDIVEYKTCESTKNIQGDKPSKDPALDREPVDSTLSILEPDLTVSKAKSETIGHKKSYSSISNANKKPSIEVNLNKEHYEREESDKTNKLNKEVYFGKENYQQTESNTDSNAIKNTRVEVNLDKDNQREASDNKTNNIRKQEVNLDTSEAVEKSPLKRRLSGVGVSIPASSKNIIYEPSSKKNIKCGLCDSLFSKADWEEHVANEHHLIAWKAGGSINLNDPTLLNELKKRLKTLGKLQCSVCNLQYETRKFNKFMEHIKHCLHQKLSNTGIKTVKPPRKSRTAVIENVTCGVCQETMESSRWVEHIGRNHTYLAWMQGRDALNVNDEAAVWQHLQNIIRANGDLTCYKCGLARKRVKTYLEHIKTCDGSGISMDESTTSLDLNSSSKPGDRNIEPPVEDGNVKCGVCKQEVIALQWMEHISKEHNYLAWTDGDTPLDLDDEDAVWNHLQQIIREEGGLTCHKCGLIRKRAKLYLSHVETCDGTDIKVNNLPNNTSLNTTTTSTDDWYEIPIVSDEMKLVKCGVCSKEVPILEWIDHIRKEHDYLACQEGSPMNLDDESELWAYLLEISRQAGGLICNKCEKKMKYPKKYLKHVKDCDGITESLDGSKSNSSIEGVIEIKTKKKSKHENVTCGVCATQVESGDWLNHIEVAHQYMAWIEGQPPLNLDDAAMVQKHLNDVSKTLGGLTCLKCGVKRKYVKTYKQHVETCQGTLTSSELSFELMKKDILECAVCGEKVKPKAWRDHAMNNHYNIAWVVGDLPIELNNPYAVESYLKEYYHVKNKLVCKVCNISRVSYVGFYAHIITCGKTEEEMEMYKTVCDICHNKYLLIYKSQHMTMHREKELALERKLLAAKEKLLKKDEPENVILTGRRKAAEKAKTVIEKYKNTFHDGSYHCSTCGFSSDIEKELSEHVCVEDKWGAASDSDESVKLENCSDDDSDESDIDSNVSDEERDAREQASHKKKRHSDNPASKIIRIPYQIQNVSSYMKRSQEEFAEMYLTDEDLFPQWHSCEFEPVPENEVAKYMPPIEESCKVRFDENGEWQTFKRFESNKVKDTMVMFLGASIQCMSWVPALAHAERAAPQPQLLALAAHAHHDAPRRAWDHSAPGPALLQIWGCDNLIASTPEFLLGIAHDYGTVWAIDWCPSGARDDYECVPEPNMMHRLGLLAVACSNGSAYIFSVPYPSAITEKDKLFYKLKPVVELRLASNENRKIYQASAIKWSVQKGHSHVVVGYADGTTAYYDINGQSPLLRTTENNITVFYPYYDERVQNSCIEDVDIYPSASRESAAGVGGAVCVGSAGGASAGALQSHVAAARVRYPPHWPAALLAGDECLVNQSINELEWWGGGRRLGGQRAVAGCAWCARLAAASPPLLRLMRLHPCYPEVHKLIIAKLHMVPLGGKRKRQNDELAMIVEPIKYSDCVNKYGIEFKMITTKDRSAQQKLSALPRDVYPERFPLADTVAMQFCPTFKHHHKLAVAMHAGIVFIISV